MPGYRGTYSDDFVRQLVDKIVLLEGRVRELEKPTATQKARVVLRLGQAEVELDAAEARITSNELYIQDIWIVDANQTARIGGVESRATSLELYTQGLWAVDAAHDARISAAQSTANGAASAAATAQATANAAQAKADQAQSTASSANGKANGLYRDLVRLYQELHQKGYVTGPPPSDPSL